jgi:hypothetical protein
VTLHERIKPQCHTSISSDQINKSRYRYRIMICNFMRFNICAQLGVLKICSLITRNFTKLIFYFYYSYLEGIDLFHEICMMNLSSNFMLCIRQSVSLPHIWEKEVMKKTYWPQRQENHNTRSSSVIVKSIFMKKRQRELRYSYHCNRPWGSTSFRQLAHRWLQGCQPYTPAVFLPPGRFLVFISVTGWVDPRAIVRLEGLDKLKNSYDIGNRNRDLPACSIVSQPTFQIGLNEIWGSVINFNVHLHEVLFRHRDI